MHTVENIIQNMALELGYFLSSPNKRYQNNLMLNNNYEVDLQTLFIIKSLLYRTLTNIFFLLEKTVDCFIDIKTNFQK